MPILSSIAVALAATLGVDLFRCPGADGVPVFTDRPCPDGEVLTLNPGNVIEAPAVSPEERRILERLRPPAARPRPPPAPRPRMDAEACRSISAALVDIKVIRRRGYRLRDAADLDAREAELRRRQAIECADA